MSPEPATATSYAERGESGEWWARWWRPTRRLTDTQVRDLAVEMPAGWQRYASCAQADPEAWFPVIGAFATRQVLTTCAHCPVRRACMAAALMHGEHGVWAGTTEIHRHELYQMLRGAIRVADVLDQGLADHDTRHNRVRLDGAA